MPNLAKLDFLALDISGQNYLSWVLDAEMNLAANGLGDTIQAGKTTTVEQKAKAMIFLRHHLHENLKYEYLTVKDPLVLWNHLKDRYEHQKTVILPRARYDWVHLRFQDFKTVSEYNSAMFKITSQLTLCGEKITDEEMLEKTFSTFHASNLLLQQQYRERGFKKYCDLISCLLVAEQNNELLMKNHESRPTGSAPLLEANMVNGGRGRGSDRGRGRGHGRGRGRGRGQVRGFGRGNYHGFQFGNTSGHKKWQDKGKMIKNDGGEKTKGAIQSICYRCGGTNHWARACRTPRHLVELYQRSQKNNGKGVEVNFAYDEGKIDSLDIDSLGIDNLGVPEDPNDNTHLDVSDFLIHE